MPDPAWPSSPPEANYLRLAGSGAAGTATTLACGAAWQALMAGGEAAFSASALNTAVTATSFEGVGGTSSAASINGLNAALQLLAGWVQEKPPIAVSAVAAYETAVSSMIPAEVAMANRAEQAADVALNPVVLGALTPAIVALDTVYFGEFWPHNAGAGAAYGAALAALVPALAVPPPLSPPGAALAAPAVAAEALAESAGQAAAGEAMKQSAQLAKSAGDTAVAPAGAVGQAAPIAAMLGQPMQMATGAMQPMLGMFGAPMQAFGGLAGLPQSFLGQLAADPGWGLDGQGIANAALAGVGPTTGGLGGAPGSGAGGVGPASAGAAGSAGMPGAGMTSYARPAATFGAESGGRPTTLKTGLLSAAEPRGPVTAGMGGSAMPVMPGQPVSANSKGGSDRDGVAHSRVVFGAAEAPQRSG